MFNKLINKVKNVFRKNKEPEFFKYLGKFKEDKELKEFDKQLKQDRKKFNLDRKID